MGRLLLLLLHLKFILSTGHRACVYSKVSRKIGVIRITEGGRDKVRNRNISSLRHFSLFISFLMDRLQNDRYLYEILKGKKINLLKKYYHRATLKIFNSKRVVIFKKYFTVTLQFSIQKMGI